MSPAHEGPPLPIGPMKAAYTPPSLDEVGGVATLTAAFGTSPRADFSEFPLIPASNGSFDICDSDDVGADSDPDFCER